MKRLPYTPLHTYTVEQGGQRGANWLNLSPGTIQIKSVAPGKDRWRPLHVTGLIPTDIAVVVMHAPWRWQRPSSPTAGFLVTHEGGGDGIITPSDLVEEDPERWVTPRLRHLIESLDVADELRQLTLDKLAAYILDTSTT